MPEKSSQLDKTTQTELIKINLNAITFIGLVSDFVKFISTIVFSLFAAFNISFILFNVAALILTSAALILYSLFGALPKEDNIVKTILDLNKLVLGFCPQFLLLMLLALGFAASLFIDRWLNNLRLGRVRVLFNVLFLLSLLLYFWQINVLSVFYVDFGVIGILLGIIIHTVVFPLYVFSFIVSKVYVMPSEGLQSSLFGIKYGADLIRFIPLYIFSLFIYRIMADFFVFCYGLMTSKHYRCAVISGLRLPPERLKRYQAAPRFEAIWNSVKHVTISLLIGLCVSAVIITLFITLHEAFVTDSGRRLTKYISDQLAFLGQNFGFEIKPSSSFVLIIGLPLALAFTAITVLRKTKKLPLGFMAEWAIITSIGTPIFAISVSHINNFGNVYAGVIMGFPLLLSLLALRQIVWRGIHKAWDRILSAQQITLENSAQEKNFRPVLYLRAFADDQLTLSSRTNALDFFMGSPAKGQRFEELIAQRAFNWRPIVALGNPHLPFQLHGVLKKNVNDANWKEEVQYWHKKSAYLMMISNQTKNIDWEMELIKSTNRQYRAIYVVTSANRANEFFKYYRILQNAELAAVPHNTLAVYYHTNRGWTAITSSLRTYTAYSIALDLALAHIECVVRTPEYINKED